jgi:hypothetical protein
MPDFAEASTSVLRELNRLGRDAERMVRPRPQSGTPTDSDGRRPKRRRSRFESALVELEDLNSTTDRLAAAPAPSTTATNPQTPFVERRLYPRHGSGSRVAVCRHPKNTTLTSQDRNWRLHSTDLKGDLLDISLYSVAFSLPSPLPVGETVYLRLSNPCTSRTLDVPGIVQRCQPLGGSAAGTTQVVCTLRRKLSLPEVQLFGRLPGEQLI